MMLTHVLQNARRMAVFMYLELISDTLFCILYIFDIQWAVSHNDEPEFDQFVKNTQIPEMINRWIWINRRRPTFYVCVWFALFNIISLSLRIGFSDRKVFTFLSFMTLIGLFLHILKVYINIMDRSSNVAPIYHRMGGEYLLFVSNTHF
jgi:hypothetical protein